MATTVTITLDLPDAVKLKRTLRVFLVERTFEEMYASDVYKMVLGQLTDQTEYHSIDEEDGA